ncbi:MAG: TonB-dependent receptor domain-containing protein [Hyphomicrobium sp.]
MYRSIWAPLACAATITVAAAATDSRVLAQATDAKPAPLPKVTVEQSETPVPTKPSKKKTLGKAKQPAAIATAPPSSAVAGQTSGAGAIPNGVPASRAGSLTSPNTAEARAEIDRTPGAVEIVPDTAYKASTPSATIKDALDYVPGVFAQPKWGDDTRLSIRGSGLSRNFHLRGLQLYMDGIPINTADGFGDFQEIDPTAYRYIEVYKGANALRFGANSLGGAINFVMPTGYDSSLFGARVDLGSFGFHKLAVSSGGVSGPVDYFITGTAQELDGFREHSWGESARGSFDVGYRLSEDAETRVYLNANWVRQRIPGEVTKLSALTSPQTADPLHVTNDWQRNIDTLRVADKTAVRLGPGTLLEVGAFNVDRHLMHPIFLWLDYTYDDYGGFAKLSDLHLVDGHKNRLIAGVNLLNGNTDAKMFGIGPDAAKLNLLSKLDQTARNFTFYAEDSFELAPGFALVAGTNYLHAVREQGVVFSLIGDQAGGQTFDLWSPKLGLLWDVDPGWQVFANVNKSAEIPSFGENQIGNPILTAQAQEAVTYEIGTRGRRTDYSWDLAVYRANIDHELQCLNANLGSFCQVVNANETIHQGIEAGFGAAVWKSIVVTGTNPDKLWLNTAYTFSDFRFDHDPSFGDNQIPGAPRHYLRSELLYKHPSGIYFGPDIEWVPEAYYVDNANTFKSAGYAIWGAKAGFDNGGSWAAYVEGRNLSDKAYVASTSIVGNAAGADLPLFNPGSGREVYGGVQYRW